MHGLGNLDDFFVKVVQSILSNLSLSNLSHLIILNYTYICLSHSKGNLYFNFSTKYKIMCYIKLIEYNRSLILSLLSFDHNLSKERKVNDSEFVFWSHFQLISSNSSFFEYKLRLMNFHETTFIIK